MELVAVDIGGTHARFALAEVADGRVITLSEPVTLKTADHASLQTAWETYRARAGRPVPRAAALAVACPVDGEVLKFTNNPWSLRPAQIGESLGLDRHILINDFAAVGHAIASLGSEHLAHICGPNRAFGPDEVISIVGPGTGLGVAQIFRRNGRSHIVATEGGHIDFAPLDTLEDALLARLRQLHDRVSVERILSGPGLVAIHDVLAAMDGRTVPVQEVQALWTLALAGSDTRAAAALDRFCMTLGSVAGDIALAQGGTAVVIAGGLGQRLASHLPRSGFVQRFAAKGRYEARMAGIPVRIVTHPQPGLYGAAAAFAGEYR